MKNKEGISKLAIIYGDNDFGNTFQGVAKLLENAALWHGVNTLPKDKEKLLLIINKLSPICYLAYQNVWEYNGLQHISALETDQSEEFLHISKYLEREVKHILIDEEVDEYVKINYSGNNSETIIMDLTIAPNCDKTYFF